MKSIVETTPTYSSNLDYNAEVNRQFMLMLTIINVSENLANIRANLLPMVGEFTYLTWGACGSHIWVKQVNIDGKCLADRLILVTE